MLYIYYCSAPEAVLSSSAGSNRAQERAISFHQALVRPEMLNPLMCPKNVKNALRGKTKHVWQDLLQVALDEGDHMS